MASKRYLIMAICLTPAWLCFSAAPSGAQQNVAAQASGGTVQVATVPAGTRMMVRMIDPVDSDNNRVNDRFRGSLEANLVAGSQLVAPKGTTVYGRLLTAESSGRRSGGELELDLTDIMLDGKMYSLATSSNEIQGAGSGGQAAASTARGAGTGAAIGGMAGGGSGLALGAGAGAIAGKITGGTTRGEKVKVPADTLVEFTLEHPVTLPVTQK